MSTDENGLKIVELKSENIMRVRSIHLELDPEAGLVVIGGKNDQGKTTVLNSFVYALGGARDIPDEPLRRGAEKGEVEVTLEGDSGTTYTVTRTFTQAGSYLTVEDADGRAYKSPQAMLDSFLGDLSFDPLSFKEKSAKEQREMLLSAVGLTEDMEANQKKIDAAFQKRRDLRKEVQRLEGKLEGEEVPDPPGDMEELPDELVDKEGLYAELRAARAKREENQEARREREFQHEKLTSEIADLEALETKLSDKDSEISEIKERIASIGAQREKYKEKYTERLEALDEQVEGFKNALALWINEAESKGRSGAQPAQIDAEDAKSQVKSLVQSLADKAFRIVGQIETERSLREEDLDFVQTQREELRASIRAQEEAIEEQEEKVKEATEAAPDPEEDPDIDAIEAKLERADKVNELIRERDRIRGLRKEYEDAQERFELAEKELEDLRLERQKMAEEADMPLDGLTVADGQVQYNGFPFGQLSSSKQLKVSLAVAAALNPDLRVIRVEDGSLLDSESMEQIRDFAKQNDFHIWVERVGTEGVSVVIEDGEVAGASEGESADSEE